MKIVTGIVIVLAIGVAGCGQPAPKALSPAQAAERAAAMIPRDARIADLYGQSCKACHAVADTGAPLVGDETAWAQRWRKGMPALMQSTVSGFGGMPAGGQCFTCTPADYEALIRFLAGKEDAK